MADLSLCSMPELTPAKRSWSTVKTGDKRLISYAVDLGTRITTKFDSTGESGARDPCESRHAHRVDRAPQETRTYTILNVDQKPKTLVIEHPERPGYNAPQPNPPRPRPMPIASK